MFKLRGHIQAPENRGCGGDASDPNGSHLGLFQSCPGSGPALCSGSVIENLTRQGASADCLAIFVFSCPKQAEEMGFPARRVGCIPRVILCRENWSVNDNHLWNNVWKQTGSSG